MKAFRIALILLCLVGALCSAAIGSPALYVVNLLLAGINYYCYTKGI